MDQLLITYFARTQPAAEDSRRCRFEVESKWRGNEEPIYPSFACRWYYAASSTTYVGVHLFPTRGEFLRAFQMGFNLPYLPPSYLINYTRRRRRSASSGGGGGEGGR